MRRLTALVFALLLVAPASLASAHTPPVSPLDPRAFHEAVVVSMTEAPARLEADADALRAIARQQEAARRAATDRASRSRSSAGGVWAALRRCENGGSYTSAPGDRYRGAYQFDRGTWAGLGYEGDPADAAPAVQDEAARRLQARSGWGQWPRCARRLGLL